mmetsp:Transcript_16116/g.44603  ORF Transcript_16116/g.44603 Transcript_16116/m.44603 type:complete len:217 (-) Transcript_16116:339-989(-)
MDATPHPITSHHIRPRYKPFLACTSCDLNSCACRFFRLLFFVLILVVVFIVVVVFIIVVVIVVVFSGIDRPVAELGPKVFVLLLDRVLVVRTKGKLGDATALLAGQVQTGLGFRSGPGFDGGFRCSHQDGGLQGKTGGVVKIDVLFPSLVLDGVAVPQGSVLGLRNRHVGSHLADLLLLLLLLLSADGCGSGSADNVAGCRKHGLCCCVGCWIGLN